MKLNLSILTLNEDGEWEDPSEGIYSVLNDSIRKESIPTMRYLELKYDREVLNWNTMIGSASEYFKDDFIHYAFHCLYSHADLAWEDILKINWLDTEVTIDYQCLKDSFFEDSLVRT
jgi:hypothetical protein